MTKTVFVPWNQIIVLPPIQINLVDDSKSTMPKVKPNIAYSFLNSLQYRFADGNANDTTVICPEHDHELLKPILTSTWMPNAIGSMAGRSTIFAENQVRLNSFKIIFINFFLLHRLSKNQCKFLDLDFS